jgi:hypothetical protein
MGLPATSQEIEAIVKSLEERGARAAPIQEATDLARSHPEAVADLVSAVVRRYPKGGTFLDAALSYLPEKSWPDLVRFALDALQESRDNEAADSVIAYASLQAVSTLHPHLDRIFDLSPNRGTYYENYPWRGSSTCHFEFLRRVIESPASEPGRKLKAWQALVQTRHPDSLAYALSHADPVLAASPWTSKDDTILAYLHLVGYHQDDQWLRRLCPDSLYHIAFPGQYFEGQTRPAWLARIDPTWGFAPAPDLPPMKFGGLGEGQCSACAGRLHRLIVLDPVPIGLGISGLGRIELATCLSCLGWERSPLFFRHDSDGRADAIGTEGPNLVPQFPVGPLREAEVRLASTPDRWRRQDWALSNSRENLNRVGGEPCWVQDAEYPDCPVCGSVMSHLMQLDSDLITAEGGEWLWGSGGIGYVSWCDRCKVSGHIWQCT